MAQVLGRGQPQSCDSPSYTYHIYFQVSVFSQWPLPLTFGSSQPLAMLSCSVPVVCPHPTPILKQPISCSFTSTCLFVHACSCSKTRFQADGFYYRAAREHQDPVWHRLLSKHKLPQSRHAKVQMHLAIKMMGSSSLPLGSCPCSPDCRVHPVLAVLFLRAGCVAANFLGSL